MKDTNVLLTYLGRLFDSQSTDDKTDRDKKKRIRRVGK